MSIIQQSKKIVEVQRMMKHLLSYESYAPKNLNSVLGLYKKLWNLSYPTNDYCNYVLFTNDETWHRGQDGELSEGRGLINYFNLETVVHMQYTIYVERVGVSDSVLSVVYTKIKKQIFSFHILYVHCTHYMRVILPIADRWYPGDRYPVTVRGNRGYSQCGEVSITL